jgi:hypothetical protein
MVWISQLESAAAQGPLTIAPRSSISAPIKYRMLSHIKSTLFVRSTGKSVALSEGLCLPSRHLKGFILGWISV